MDFQTECLSKFTRVPFVSRFPFIKMTICVLDVHMYLFYVKCWSSNIMRHKRFRIFVSAEKTNVISAAEVKQKLEATKHKAKTRNLISGHVRSACCSLVASRGWVRSMVFA